LQAAASSETPPLTPRTATKVRKSGVAKSGQAAKLQPTQNTSPTFNMNETESQDTWPPATHHIVSQQGKQQAADMHHTSCNNLSDFENLNYKAILVSSSNSWTAGKMLSSNNEHNDETLCLQNLHHYCCQEPGAGTK
jgi:hypothetical protein